ncbi:uncharacterized protein M6B38_182000 [Iris pallida]|uniref:Uncharacterized protein n=1 Tax=Iris pallida TaxID=29817 RepID=A0AAX6ELX7_IRIPA|nr:uncharacterized protein M6B38_182000 [Iris pallida]
MRILSWVQNKLNGSQEKKKYDTGSCSSRRTSIPDDRKEEFSDWPQSLLSIGTFGNSGQKESLDRQNPPENLHSSQNLSDFSVEEVVKLQKELTKLLTHKPKSSTDGSEKGGERANHPLNRFLNCPSSLEVERRDCLRLCGDLDGGENNGDLSPNTRIILNKAKDILADKSNAIRKKSLTFLLKKMFVCRSGFTQPPSLRDPLPESRMEKLLKTILHKQIYTQSQSSNNMAAKKCLEKKPTEKIGYKDEVREKEDDGSKWVKTDSEYIVLEI